MSIPRLPLNKFLTLYLLEDEAFLFSACSRRLFGLDRSATFLLLQLADGETVTGLTATLGLGASEAAAAEELAALLAGHDSTAEEFRTENTYLDEVPHCATTSPCYRLLTTCFTLDCPDPALRTILTASLQHLLFPECVDLNLIVSVQPEGSLWRLCLNGTSQGGALPADMLLPVIHGRLRAISYQRFPYLLALHASVVSDGCRTIVLAGRSGTGKSTLAATLLVRGYRLFSDEVALLDQDGDLVSIPLALCLKEGSWPLLVTDFPDLAAPPVHIRLDGIRLRYLKPGNIALAEGGDNRRATHLCFPRFQPGGAAQLERLSPVDALRRLSETGYQVPDLTVENVDQIIAWMCGLSCFSLTYSSTEEALRLLDTAVNDHAP